VATSLASTLAKRYSRDEMVVNRNERGLPVHNRSKPEFGLVDKSAGRCRSNRLTPRLEQL
jgi:hypothetical protein